jgi:UDP-N-acetylglucosamine pyrophosphorylase
MPFKVPSNGTSRCGPKVIFELDPKEKKGEKLWESMGFLSRRMTDTFHEVALEYVPAGAKRFFGNSVFNPFFKAAQGYMPHIINWFLDRGPNPSLLKDPRVNGVYRNMQRRIPIDYEPIQVEYYIRHLRNWLKASAKGSGGRMSVSLYDSSIAYFTEMDADEKSKYLIDIGELEQDETLLDDAKGISIAVEELNGGVGSSMGMDPTKGLSKANVEFQVSIKTEKGDVEADRSVMEAKLLHHAWLKSHFQKVHVIPGNGMHTDKGWHDFLAARSKIDSVAAKPARTHAQYFRDSGLVIHEPFVQQGFPLLEEDTLMPIESDDFERTVVPGGHGQHLYHLYFSGKMHELLRKGVQVLVFENYDNVNATPNPYVVAKMIRDNIMAGIISTDRSGIDAKGGVFAVRNGKLDLIERAQVPKQQMNKFESLGLKEGEGTQPFNTNTPYLNLPLLLSYLDKMRKSHGPYAIHKLLLPETIQNMKSFTHTVNGERRTEKDLVHLEGAICSSVLKLPGVKLFNADADHRIGEFTPLKTPIDVVYHYDSDAFRYDEATHQLIKVGESAPPAIEMAGWAGWKNLYKTRAAFGNPSFKLMDSLRVYGEVRVSDAVFGGKVELIDLSGEGMDVEDDQLNFVRVVKTAKGNIVVEDSEEISADRPIDIVYRYDSDAFEYDASSRSMVRVNDKNEPRFELDGWDGWKDIAKTRRALGQPSFKELSKLMVFGQVQVPDALFRGKVELINLSDQPFDLVPEEVIEDYRDDFGMTNVRIVKKVTGEVEVRRLTPYEPSPGIEEWKQMKVDSSTEAAELNRPRSAGELGYGVMDCVKNAIRNIRMSAVNMFRPNIRLFR